MINLREYKKYQDKLCDLLPFAGLVEKGVILNKDGSFLSTIRFRGPDLDSATESELMSLSLRVNNVFKRFGSGYAIYVESQRKKFFSYPESNFPDKVTWLIDKEREEGFKQNSHFESEYYLTIVYLPEEESKNKVASFFLNNSSEGINYKESLRNFIAERERVLKLFQSILPEAESLDDSELLTYLHSTVSDKEHKVVVPKTPMYLDAVLSDTSLLPGLKPKLGKKYINVIGIKGFPSVSEPGLLDRLNRLSIEYRWVSRFIFMEKSEGEAELNKYKKRWFSKRKSLVTLLKETFTGSQSVMEDSDAVNKAMDCDEAIQELMSDVVSYGYFTLNIVLSHTDKKILEEESKEVEKIINGMGFCTTLETINAVDAWLGTIPGNCRNNVRRPIVNTLNFAHMIPLSAVWAGAKENEHLKAPPLFIAYTNETTQFRFVNHVGDVGHTLIIGPTGAGKSVLLNFIEAQFRRYEDSQVYIFDKGGSAKVLTYAVGGEYYSLGDEDGKLSFQPLSNIDDLSERRWAQEWLIDILTEENVTVTPSIKETLWIALSSLSTAPTNERTIFGLTVLLQNEELRQALLSYTIQGAHGELLDNSRDNLKLSSWQCFEMEKLMSTPSVVLPVLSFLFHRLEKSFTGKPTLLVLDEAWLFLDNESFSAKIREWLKVLRKSNVSVIFSTQSLSDIENSSISQTIKEACFTKIYLPNSTAFNEEISLIYRKFGLNDTQIRILAEAIPKKQYYYTSPLGNRLFELGLEGLALAYCGSTSKEEQREVTEIRERTSSEDEFNYEFLKFKNLHYVLEHFETKKLKKVV